MRRMVILIQILFALSPAALHAQDCATLVREYSNWMMNRDAVPAGTFKAVGFTIASNQRNDQVADTLRLPILNDREAALKSVNTVAYGIGDLDAITDGRVVVSLEGVGLFYFSDRSTPGRGVHIGFTGTTDAIRLQIAPDGNVAITLVAWGNGIVPIRTRCENGVLFGFGNGLGGSSRPAMYVISLYKHLIRR